MTDSTACSFEVDADNVGWLTLDKPGSSANTLGRAVLLDLQRQIEIAEGRALRGLVIRSGKPSGFIAGADIREFTSFDSEAAALELITLGQRVCSRIEALPYPTAAAIHGFALGGGLELALACDYRIGVGDSKLVLGLPEVQLGIHPGFGGTVRSVRLLGVRPAMSLMLTGRTVSAEEADRRGLVSEIVAPEVLVDRALEIASQIAELTPLGVQLTKRSLQINTDAAGLKPALELENRNQVLSHATEEAAARRQSWSS